MSKHRGKVFQDKFHLLNSQEHSEEIIWSLSDTSDYEDTCSNNQLTNRTRIMKRKRKNKALRNISNLNIAILDTKNESEVLECAETSPILTCKLMSSKNVCHSPILASQHRTKHISPVLPSHSRLKSPILATKSVSPKTAAKVSKRLFSNIELDNEKKIYFDIKHNKQPTTEENYVKVIGQDSLNTVKTKIIDQIDDLTCRSGTPEKKETLAKLHLVNKVKTFFDSHFSNESTPQNSQTISDITTEKNNSRNSDDLEILSCKTQEKNNSTSSKDLSMPSSDNSVFDFNKHNKKVRYKKDGLAHRLNKLLKKQNAYLSLWQHERFLAANSNFQIPKGEFTVFQIQKVQFSYGCYLLEVLDLNDDKFLVIINKCYVFDSIQNDTVIKVYEPFNVVQLKGTKVLINVCKFECSQYMV